MKGYRCALALAGVLHLIFSAPVWGQTSTAVLNGSVVDSSGGIVSNAEISLTHADTSIRRESVSNDAGLYAFLNLPPGSYIVSVRKPGFKGWQRSGLVLAVNQTATVDVQLELGDTTQSVLVEATAEQLQASTAELGSVVESKQVVGLPLNGRNFTQLLTLTPGVSPISVGQNNGGLGVTSTQGAAVTFPSVNGQTNQSNMFLLDGINNVGTFTNSYALPPIIDTIQEFKVQSHNDQAEFGGVLGGIINLVSRSGTNRLHGSAWEFLRNDALDARNTFLAEKTPFRQNQFGGTIGGPVVLPRIYNGRNRTFFFGAAQGFLYRRPSDARIRVPTEANLRGDLSDDTRRIYDPYSTVANPDRPGVFTRTQFPGNIIPPSRIDQGMVLWANTVLPKPEPTANPRLNAIDRTNFRQNQRDWSVKFDHTMGVNDFFWFRYSRMDQDSVQSGGLPSLPQLRDQKGRNWGFAYTKVLSPSFLIDARYGQAYLNNFQFRRFVNAPADFAQQVGFSQRFSQSSKGVTLTPALSIEGYAGGGEMDQDYTYTNIKHVATNVTKIRGAHSFKFGFELASNNYSGGQFSNSSTFRTPQTSDPSAPANTGNELASFLLNLPDGATKFDSIESFRWGGVMSLYVQDQWKPTSRWTINYGLRYDRSYKPPYGRAEDKNLDVGTYDFRRGVYLIQNMPGLCSDVGVAPCIPGTGLPANVELDPEGRLFRDDKKNFGPRLGIAYRITPKTVLRSSFGVLFDSWGMTMESSQGIVGSWPGIGLRIGVNLNNQLATAPLPDTPGTDPFPLGAIPDPTPFNQVNWFVDPNEKQPYSLQYNFGIQHQIDQASTLTLNYVGAGSRRLVVSSNMYNVAVTPGPGNPRDRSPFPYITPTIYDYNGGSSNYHSLQALLSRRFQAGFAYTLSYTWSKTIDFGGTGWYSGTQTRSLQNPYDLNGSKSVAGFDVPHVFVGNWVYDVPIGPGRTLNQSNRVLSHLLGNWQVNGIATFRSGQPYSLRIPGDGANTGNSNYLRPDYIGGKVELENPTWARWFNTAAFAIPAPFRFGTAGRNILRADGVANLDLSLFRIFPWGEGRTIEFRAESFNALNSPVYAIPVNTVTSALFGQVTSTANLPRQVQLALKLVF